MKNITKKFKVTNGRHFSLKDFSTGYSGDYSKDESEALLSVLIKETVELQEKLYADNRYAILVIFQGMDAAGKDGAISHTLSGINPQGCEVYSFKQPSALELKHDFLWRHIKAMPEYGRICVHNRSHYENVLVTKVHPEILMKQLPGNIELKDIDTKFWDNRYKSIRNLEKYLADNNTVIIKFFLYLSEEEQKERFLKRMDDETKNWKYEPGDLHEREFWDDYMKAYQEAIRETAAKHAPWYVVPADKKWFTRIAVSSIILDTLKDLDLKYPVLPEQDEQQMEQDKKVLMKEKLKPVKKA